MIIELMPGGTSRAAGDADALAAAITRLPSHLARSLTWDLGHEMAQHDHFPPRCAREVPPAIARELNERPRQTLGFRSPSQVLAEVLR
ncbi:hypothetical protein GTR00_19965 [Kineococcus sp. T90]|uniref:hypothetical protein n=1 Tax=Kineococcus indalonis TaxID=2696566 RepID=UPI0014131B09|nr:hypothetical protein [Kineococcus indalonis]NAZ88346.1 hypothetical protein [Kineococcus indalonis]